MYWISYQRGIYSVPYSRSYTECHMHKKADEFHQLFLSG